MYCVYTDTDIPDGAGNRDHIIPLSLGGRDQFTVWSDNDFNSRMGEVVDGAMANDPLLQIVRSRATVRGHSNSKKPPTWKKVEINGQPGQMVWTPEGLRLWDARERHYVENEGVEPIPISARIKFDIFTATRFAAKVSLGGTYFIYGDLIRQAVDCDILRKLITLDPETARGDQHLLDSGVRVCDRVHPDSQRGEGATYRALCEFKNRSIFIAVPHVDGITLSIGLLGTFVATIILRGDGSILHNDADQHDLGHVVVLGPGSMERMSYRNLASEFYKVATGKIRRCRPLDVALSGKSATPRLRPRRAVQRPPSGNSPSPPVVCERYARGCSHVHAQQEAYVYGPRERTESGAGESDARAVRRAAGRVGGGDALFHAGAER